MHSLMLAAIEFVGSFQYSQQILAIMILIGALLILSLLGFAVEYKHSITKKQISILTVSFCLSVFFAATSVMLLRGTTLAENTCFTNTYRNLNPTDKSLGADYQQEISKLNEAIKLGEKLNVSNMNDLLERKQRFEKILAEWSEYIKEDQTYPKTVEYFVAKVNNGKMTIVSDSKSLYTDQVVSIDVKYSFKRVSCSPKIVQTVTELQQQNIIGFNR